MLTFNIKLLWRLYLKTLYSAIHYIHWSQLLKRIIQNKYPVKRMRDFKLIFVRLLRPGIFVRFTINRTGHVQVPFGRESMLVNERCECIRSAFDLACWSGWDWSFKATRPFLNLWCDCRVSLRVLVLSSFPSLASPVTMKAALYHQSPTTEQKLNTNYKTWQNQTFLTFKKGKTGLITTYKAGYILFTLFRIRKNVRNKIIMVCQF